jgi:hypothetical protein
MDHKTMSPENMRTMLEFHKHISQVCKDNPKEQPLVTLSMLGEAYYNNNRLDSVSDGELISRMTDAIDAATAMMDNYNRLSKLAGELANLNLTTSKSISRKKQVGMASLMCAYMPTVMACSLALFKRYEGHNITMVSEGQLMQTESSNSN